jgi:S1-C subfamily serine protease
MPGTARITWFVLIGLLLGGCATGGVHAQSRPLEDVFDDVRNSVVTITATTRAVTSTGQSKLAAAEGVGSGVLISDDGDIMTASHVVHTSDSVLITFSDGHQARGQVISSDPMTDLALVRVRDVSANAVVAALGDSDTVRVGSRVFVIGSPRGMSHTLTVGHISARRGAPRQFRGLVDVEVFQTDAAVNPGNSGGPLFNMQGEVIGIVSYIVTQSGGHEGLGFALTSNSARAILLDQPPFWSGIDSVILQGDLAKAFNIGGSAGILVQRVAGGSAGDQMGLRGGTILAQINDEEIVIGGDIIVEVLGVDIKEVRSLFEIRSELAKLSPGDTFRVVVIRNGLRMELTGRAPKIRFSGH